MSDDHVGDTVGAAGHPRSREFFDKVRTRHQEMGHTDRQLDGVALVTQLTRLVARLVQDFEASVHRPLGMTWAGFRIMNTLWVFGDMEQREIARISGTSRASVSSALNTLEERGLVERRREQGDRRLVRVSLTEPGLTMLHKAIEGQTEREHAWMGVLEDQEISQLVTLLGKMVNQEHPE
ncbi:MULTISPECIES: MarR family winged helix-turn-helix transcriptional regulator [Streptomyces]|uniref:MarR family transcriptional regulator n=1 Tax=Streptomyces griseiscabiei TaxID=2993540 RepID=A0ABU4L2D8_9ACTN|nr:MULTISPECIES: MarR family transcriptional regulator [Streptomyces]MBZ3901538.1 MarR family transcriptional regulator [Streptomyces griseiscabiei]MDX2909912.1 MarR family transcriptional regulator [Streptomyces griseiscabiei]